MRSFLLATLCCAALAVPRGFSGDETRSKRFYAGEVLLAEIKPVSSPSSIKLINVPRYAPPVAGDAYAMIVVKLDPGRSLGVYDYVLANDDGEYPCVGISAGSGRQIDASVWEIKNTKPSRKYRLLFKVPSTSRKKYTLKFKLRPNCGLEPVLTFINVKDKPFTKANTVPDDGMLGVDPYAPKPKPKPKQAATSGKSASPAKGSASKTKKDKHDADRAAWEAFLKGETGGEKEGGGK